MKIGITSRRLLAAVAATAAVVAVGACGSPDDGGSDADASGSVQVQTASGPVTIEGVPERIVTVGSQWTDTVVALGRTPVAFYDAVKATAQVRAPWLEGKLGDARELDLNKDLVTQIADLDPDLILAPGPGFMDEAKLANLKDAGVPVIRQITDQQVDPWQDLLKTAGTALREDDKATEVAASINDRIATIKSENPGLANKTFTFSAFQAPTMITVLADNNDGAARLFRELGMTFPQQQLDRAKAEKAPRFQISPENIQILDSDLLVVAAGNDELKSTLQNLPTYKGLRSVRDGAVSWMTFPEIFGLNTPSALSVPFLLDKLRPGLEAAGKE